MSCLSGGGGSGASTSISCWPSIGGGGSCVCPNGTYQPCAAAVEMPMPTSEPAARIGWSSSATTSYAKRPASRTAFTIAVSAFFVVTIW